jgi:hypothetical protein
VHPFKYHNTTELTSLVLFIIDITKKESSFVSLINNQEKKKRKEDEKKEDRSICVAVLSLNTAKNRYGNFCRSIPTHIKVRRGYSSVIVYTI